MSQSSFETLEGLAASLPFHLDNSPAVNETYVRWCNGRAPDDRCIIQVWTYCFIRRYFHVKFIQETAYGAADLDQLVETAFRKVEERESQIKEPARYSNWISVVCKNTFRNYLRRKHRPVPLEELPVPLVVAEPSAAYSDVKVAREALCRAIDRLPPHLQEYVRLRYLCGLSYGEIERWTGRSLPSIRAFVYKALKRLREDEEIVRYFANL